VLYDSIDVDLLQRAQPAIENGERIRVEREIENKNRAVGGLLSGEIARRHGEEGLPEGSIAVHFRGSAGQSFGAWLMPGVSFTLTGETNDYTGKGLAGGVLTVRPPADAAFDVERSPIVGNTVLYGATRGRAFFRGLAGERFAVRNSGAATVVEGVGDHGCEYMTGGRVVVLGPTGRNFAAGMSGGIAYVYDEHHRFAGLCNPELVELEPLEEHDEAELKDLVAEHAARTGSQVAQRILDDWDEAAQRFVKVMPRDFKRALAERAAREQTETGVAQAAAPAEA
jgi:glutamate synthase domain-containing protein 3